MKKGLMAFFFCFFCDERYFPGHKRKGQVYRLEIIEEEEDLEMKGEGAEDSTPQVLQGD